MPLDIVTFSKIHIKYLWPGWIKSSPSLRRVGQLRLVTALWNRSSAVPAAASSSEAKQPAAAAAANFPTSCCCCSSLRPDFVQGSTQTAAFINVGAPRWPRCSERNLPPPPRHHPVLCSWENFCVLQVVHKGPKVLQRA